MFINTATRSTEDELMDNFQMEGEMLRDSLDKLDAINRRLGGNKVTIDGLQYLLKNEPAGATISIIDLGCGGGDMLRRVADFGRKHNYIFKLTGIDANDYTVNYARKLSTNYPEITFTRMDVLAKEFFSLHYDIALATLFLHHFKNEEIDNLLKVITQNANKGVIINDLHRSKRAFYLFKLISFFISNPMIRKDGAISVLRAFKKNELISMGKKLQNTVSTVGWKWAFRYQWIIQKK